MMYRGMPHKKQDKGVMFRYELQQPKRRELLLLRARAMTPFPEDYSVAMAYVPIQTDISVYDEMKALEVGTLFPVLNKPFNPARCSR